MRGLDFKPVDPKSIPSKATGRTGSRYAVTLGEFMRSASPAIEVECGEKNPHAISGQLAKHVKLAGLDGQVSVLCRRGRVFMVRVTE